jgi:proline- and glutamine-rich splicing factor
LKYSVFITIFSSLRPVVLEPFEQLDDIDGYAEKSLPKKNPEYYKAREVSIRFESKIIWILKFLIKNASSIDYGLLHLLVWLITYCFQVGPRFASPGSFEYEYGTRWKQLYELYKQKEEALEREMKMEEEKLEAQMEYARYEHETEILRERKFF